MKNGYIKASFMALFATVSILTINGCKETFSLNSAWLNRKITIDGKDHDWVDGHLYDDEDISSKIGIYNDSNDLYVCLIIKDRGIERQIFQQGFTMWLSRSGENNKVWGLHCKLEAERPEGARHRADSNSEAGSERAGTDSGDQRRQWRQSATRDFSMSLKQLELLTSEKDPGQIMTSDEFSKVGIRAAFSREDDGGFVYEVEIPLEKSEKTPYAALQSKKRKVVLGFLTAKASGSATGDRSSYRGGFGSGARNGDDTGNSNMAHIDNLVSGNMGNNSMGYGGMGGGGMGSSGMGRSGMGRRGMSRSGTRHSGAKALDFWSVIDLASNPDTAR